jgi:hypothetical protein
MDAIHNETVSESAITFTPALTLKEVAAIFKNRFMIQGFVKSGKLRPLAGGRGRRMIFDPADVKALWEDLKKEE